MVEVACSRLRSKRASNLTNSPQRNVLYWQPWIIVSGYFNKMLPQLEEITLEVIRLCILFILFSYQNKLTNILKTLPLMEFLKFILARSPKLKRLSILSGVGTNIENVEMLTSILWAPWRASMVEIFVEHLVDF